jgi:protein subunit release factor B
MPINPIKKDAISQRMSELDISEGDIEERFVLGSGKGGQKVNKTSSCVVLRYPPLNIVVKCQKDRSREVNRVLARRALCDRVEEVKTGTVSSRDSKINKIRQQKKRRKRKSSEKYNSSDAS